MCSMIGIVVTVYTAGRNEEHADEEILQIIVFNDDIKVRQGKVD